MPGEHWCSICEKTLRKYDDPYTKILWRNWLTPKSEVTGIVCRECEKKDGTLGENLPKLFKEATKPPLVRRPPCSLCGNPINRKKRHLHIEFMNISKPKEELWATVCDSCIAKLELDRLHIPTQNPQFLVNIHCLSQPVCKSFVKPKHYRGINCQNIVVNMDGNLYCRRAHPGHVRLYREKWAFPPSSRLIRSFFKDYYRVFKPFLAYMEARWGFKSPEEARKVGLEEKRALEKLTQITFVPVVQPKEAKEVIPKVVQKNEHQM